MTSSINSSYLEHLVFTDQTFHHPLIEGIYPRVLDPSVTMEGPPSTTWETAHGRPNRLATMRFHKRTVLPLCKLRIIRSPHVSSHISDLAKYGIVISHFHRFFASLCDTVTSSRVCDSRRLTCSVSERA